MTDLMIFSFPSIGIIIGHLHDFPVNVFPQQFYCSSPTKLHTNRAQHFTPTFSSAWPPPTYFQKYNLLSCLIPPSWFPLYLDRNNRHYGPCHYATHLSYLFLDISDKHTLPGLVSWLHNKHCTQTQ